MLSQVEQTTLSNGVRVITTPVAHVESAAAGLWVGSGSRHEPARWAGISHFLEHMLFKGTARRSALQISRTIEGRGGYLNAFTQEESTCYYARVGYDQLAGAFDVLTDMLRHARCSQSDTVKERQVILEEMRMYGDQPAHVADELLQDAVWPGHPLGRPVIGLTPTVGGMQGEDLLAYRDRYYVPRRIVAAFAGRVDHAACVAWTQAQLGDMASRRIPAYTPFEDTLPQRRQVRVEREIEQTHLALGIRLFGSHDPRRYILRVLNVILGENMSSRLFQVVREKHGLAYSVHSMPHLQSDSGALVITAGLDRHRGEQALALILRELRRMVQEPVKAAELKRAKDYVIGQMRLALENTSSQMMWIGGNLISQGRFIPPEEAIQATRAVTSEDVQALAQCYFHASAMSVAAVTPMGSPFTDERMGAAVAAGLPGRQ